MPGSAFREGQNSDEEDSKVIVRSNGTVTYVGKDIAYQLWKFGLLGKDFITGRGIRIRTATWRGLRPHVPQDELPHFGRGSRVYNVIDSRQSYLQDVVVAGIARAGLREAGRGEHSFLL